MKRIYGLILLLATMIMTGVTVRADNGEAVLNHATLMMCPGDAVRLEMTVDNKVLSPKSWKSSKPTVAAVSRKGVVRARAAGKCTITCKTGLGYSLKCKVTVRKGLEISKYLGKTYTKLLKAEKKYVSIKKSESDPLGENNLYLFPDDSLFFRFDKKTKKISVLQNSYDPTLTLYGCKLGMKAKTSHKTLKANKCKYQKTEKGPHDRANVYYQKGKHTIRVTVQSGRVEFFQWY